MSATIKSIKDKTVTNELNVKLTDLMLASENTIRLSWNEAGALVREEAIMRFDTDGAKLVFGDSLFFSKGTLAKR